MSEKESDILNIIKRIFSNWTALKMAVEHGMGTKEQAYDFCIYVDKLLSMNEQLHTTDIAAELEDYMDLEFNTKLEDNSETQVAEEIQRFNNYLKLNDQQTWEEETAKLSPIQSWILPHSNVVAHSTLKTENNEMEVDADGWSVIRRKKNK
ncbi:PREDICTED: uncharacterized protein LOC105363741 [Ceratosolen solmsi marchali]|uniref:Pre-rRNA-processing protein TSR2 homolog n=1 Tax=Ceratosolen solmsi marchali TaxID=326594 RepID=A0AAJ6YKM8_9HYME|nr:PREDICTED: uncharacterized protein LOC105363741 [Ceratosolen solmsi marchali]XP_011499808.1 PREDICTED: uncharacterized protein LOC105363741 [Ceratosolen solmsi marchali]XP_011499809.1 PREDICTED: uncharacterized protein LOC105363741 [Ceratosolen solmsi marchali]XP_011499810.1 PREDICTED: uncharacterized protein LOC105363741 [Ceratosolen solmsi marchali]